MTVVQQPRLNQSLNLDERQRAMLKEMGVRVWQPPTNVEPVAQVSVAPVATSATQVPLTAIDSGAARADIQKAPGTFDTPKQAIQVLKAAPEAASEAHNPPSTAPGPGAWRVGKLQTLYTPQSQTTAVRWLVLLESPASAMQESFNPFDDDAGKLLDNMLRAAHLHTAGSAMLVPLVRGNGSTRGLPAELAEILSNASADVVLVMGRLAAQAVLQSTEPLARLRGKIHRWHNAKIIITIDPAYLLRNPLDKAKAWDDLCLALSVAVPS